MKSYKFYLDGFSSDALCQFSHFLTSLGILSTYRDATTCLLVSCSEIDYDRVSRIVHHAADIFYNHND